MPAGRPRADVGIALSEMELDDALPRLTVPTIVIAGENDRLTPPSHARRIAEMLPQLERLIVLPDTGHMGAARAPARGHRAARRKLAATTGTVRRRRLRTELAAPRPGGAGRQPWSVLTIS